MIDEPRIDALVELSEAVAELSEADLERLMGLAFVCRGGGLEPATAPTGEELLLVTTPPSRPDGENRFWNAAAVVLADERERRRSPRYWVPGKR